MDGEGVGQSRGSIFNWLSIYQLRLFEVTQFPSVMKNTIIPRIYIQENSNFCTNSTEEIVPDVRKH